MNIMSKTGNAVHHKNGNKSTVCLTVILADSQQA